MQLVQTFRDNIVIEGRTDIKKRIIFICLIGAVITITLCLRACDEFMSLDMDAYYVSYEEAEADEAIRRGWIPEFVPRSATDIRESHNLDVNSEWLTFQFEPKDLEEMKQALKPVKIDQVSFPRGGQPWWPKDLLHASDELVAKYDFYTYQYTIQYGGGFKTDITFVAIEKDESRAWYWIPR